MKAVTQNLAKGEEGAPARKEDTYTVATEGAVEGVMSEEGTCTVGTEAAVKVRIMKVRILRKVPWLAWIHVSQNFGATSFLGEETEKFEKETAEARIQERKRANARRKKN